jgi:peptidoglycan/xylan/chitin deacetylase (PgdA/CDA1 family)
MAMSLITLSFDNGPDPEVTPLVLDVLCRHDIQTTFFVVGEKLRDRRRFTERAHAEGHWIGNHTFDHQVPFGFCSERGMAAREIEATQRLIGNLSHPRRFFRPFGGGGILDRRLLNREALQTLCDGAFSCVLWNVIPEDWARPDGWVERALSLSFAQQHALVVLHDLPTGAMQHLDRFVCTAKERGARFEQDFPTSCVLVESGEIVGPVDAYFAEDLAVVG